MRVRRDVELKIVADTRSPPLNSRLQVSREPLEGVLELRHSGTNNSQGIVNSSSNIELERGHRLNALRARNLSNLVDVNLMWA